jgi:ribosome-associated protein
MAKTTSAQSRSARQQRTAPAALRVATPARRKGRTEKPAKAVKLPKPVSGAVRAAQEKKAVDLVVLDLHKAGGFTDYFVICTGTNSRQISAIAEAVRETLKREYDERPALAEGVEKSEWILLDYFNFVVHIFSRECRAFYGLERLWGNAERYEFADEPGGSAVRT